MFATVSSLFYLKYMSDFDLEHFIPYRLYQAMENSSQSFSHVYKTEYGLTRAEWRVLFNIGLYSPITARDIVDRTYIDKTKVSRAVQKLVAKNWVTKSGDTEDRRRQTLQLTGEGKRILKKLSDRAVEHNSFISSVIEENDLDHFLNILRKIETLRFPHLVSDDVE